MLRDAAQVNSRGERLKKALSEHSSLLGILLGSFLVFMSIGPYVNWDAEVEYQAAIGVVKWGLPYITSGNLVNQPPLGYYIDALFFKTLGLSYSTGVGVITFFGLGSILLLYEIGRVFYDKRTGLLAAAVFGLTPWQAIMSRIFLIDAQCLFFSLSYLLIGILAIRRGSRYLLFASGTLFGLATLTKAFSAFMLVPLASFYVFDKQNKLRSLWKSIAVFAVPALLLNLLWYEVVSRRGILSLLVHDDFNTLIPAEIVPSNFFLIYFFSRFLGIFFLLACFLSVFLSLSQRKLFASFLVPDLVCYLTIFLIAGLDMFLVLGINLWVPYINVPKYTYPILPLFCLLSASLIGKCSSLPAWKNFTGSRRVLTYAVASAGLFLLFASMAINMDSLSWMIGSAGSDYLLVIVEGKVGYPFELFSMNENAHSWLLLGLAFVSIAVSLFWCNIDKIDSFSDNLRRSRPFNALMRH